MLTALFSIAQVACSLLLAAPDPPTVAKLVTENDAAEVEARDLETQDLVLERTLSLLREKIQR